MLGSVVIWLNSKLYSPLTVKSQGMSSCRRVLWCVVTVLGAGAADCCDGSDEYASGACPNTCDEIGAAARARQQQIDEMRLRGYEVKLKLIEEGKEKLAEKQVSGYPSEYCGKIP